MVNVRAEATQRQLSSSAVNQSAATGSDSSTLNTFRSDRIDTEVNIVHWMSRL